MANSIMKMAFVINGALNPNFTTSVGRAQKQINNLYEHIAKIEQKKIGQNINFTNGGKSVEQFDRNIQRLDNQIDKTHAKIQRFYKLMAKNRVSKANYNAVKMDFLSTIQTVKIAASPLMDAYETASNFEKAMSKVGAISLGDLKGEEYNRQLQLLTDTARRLGERTQFTATQSAEAMSYLGMAGWKTNQIIEGMPALLDLAVAGGADLARTADIISDELTAFGLGADKARHMADVFAVTITSTNTDVEKLGETMKYAAPVAYAFGASMEETAAMAGLMAGKAIKASQAGTALRTGLMRLAGPPKMAQKAMDELGLSMEDLTAEQKEAALALKTLGIETGHTQGAQKMAIILNSLREKMAGLTDEQKTSMAAAIFGKNAAAGWLAMIDTEEGAFEKLLDSLYKSEGASARVAQRMNANAKGAATRMKSAWESLQISVMNGFLPTIASMLDGLAKLVGALSKFAAENPVVAKSFILVGTAIATIVTGFATFGMVAAAIRYGYDSLILFSEGMKGCTVATKAYSVALRTARFAVPKLTAVAELFIGMTGKVAAAIKVIGLAITSLPIGWVLLGIAALVVAGTLLYKHWDKVKTFFINLWESPIGKLVKFFTPIGFLIRMASTIIENWDTLKAYLEYFWDNPEAALFRFQNWAKETFQNAVNAGRQKWDELKAVLDKPIFATFIAPAWEKVKASAANAWEGVKEKIGSAVDGVKATISGAVDSAIETVTNLPGTIASAIGYAAGYLYETLRNLPERVMQMVNMAWEYIRNLPGYIFEAGKQFLSNLAGWGTQAYTATVDFLTRMVTGAWDFLTGLPEACYNAGVAFVGRLTTWGGEALQAAITFLKDLVAAYWRFLWNLPTICMEAGRNFVSAAAQWAQDAYNSIMDWISRLPEAISNTISNAWEGIKAKFSSGFTVGVSAANNAAPVAANAKGGIYNKGAFLTTFAERSPEAAIPIDNSERAKGLWMRVGQMLGILQRPQGNAAPAMKLPQIVPANTGYEPKPSLPKISIPDSITAVGKLDVPGIFGAVLKRLHQPKETQPVVNVPAFPEIPAPIVNIATASPNVSPVVNAMANTPDINVNVTAPENKPFVQEPPIIRNIIQAVADSPIVNVPTAAAPTVNIAQNPIQAIATSPTVTALFDPTVQPAGAPDINFPDIPAQKETLIERIKEFVAPSVQNRQVTAAPSVTINNEFHFSGNVNQQEARETVERAADISFAKFREMMLQWQREQRRVLYD